MMQGYNTLLGWLALMFNHPLFPLRLAI